jgi:hypothetical protein
MDPCHPDDFPDDVIMRMWVVFRSPADLPGHIVLREHFTKRDGTTVCGSMAGYKIGDHEQGEEIALEAARMYCRSKGLVRLARSPGDPAHIVEVWL